MTDRMKEMILGAALILLLIPVGLAGTYGFAYIKVKGMLHAADGNPLATEILQRSAD